jgi:hypothetical protein
VQAVSYLERRARQYARQGKAECGFRVIDGQQDGLGPRWHHGLATIEQDEIVFVPYLGGLRFLRRAPVQIPVTSVDQGAERQPKVTEIVGTNPKAMIVRLSTPTATLEWAILPDQLAWATSRVAGQDDTTVHE